MAILRSFFAEVQRATLVVSTFEELQRESVLGEELYNWNVEMLAPVARRLLSNRSPFKRWVMIQEAHTWAIAHRKLRDYIREEHATPEGDKVLSEIGRLLGKTDEEVRAVIFEHSPAGKDQKPSDRTVTVQQMMDLNYGPHRAALRALTKLLGIPESRISDRLRRVFFYKPGAKGDPTSRRRSR